MNSMSNCCQREGDGFFEDGARWKGMVVPDWAYCTHQVSHVSQRVLILFQAQNEVLLS